MRPITCCRGVGEWLRWNEFESGRVWECVCGRVCGREGGRREERERGGEEEGVCVQREKVRVCVRVTGKWRGRVCLCEKRGRVTERESAFLCERKREREPRGGAQRQRRERNKVIIIVLLFCLKLNPNSRETATNVVLVLSYVILKDTQTCLAFFVFSLFDCPLIIKISQPIAG